MARRSGARARETRGTRAAKRAEETRLAAKRTASEDGGGERRERWRGKLWPVTGALVLAAVVCGAVLLFLSPLPEDVWRDVAPRWPGGGYGLAASAGFVLFRCVGGVVVGLGGLFEGISAWRRSREPRRLTGAAGHSLLAAGCGLLGGGGAVVVTTTLGGKGGARSDSLSVFLRGEYPSVGYAALGGIVAPLLVAPAAVRLREALGRRDREG
ncbi:hypothetical protein [Streptomyces sp. NPDC048438]|uniref:hypothetical protein n=1 Tax=Streptomyces sp. NPDC048438 TaxID=3365551 RepID=UPI003720319B